MFKTIVLALDGSEGSQRATAPAVELARRDGARLVLAHVDELVVGKGAGGPIHVDEPEIQAGIRKLATDLGAEGIPTSVEMRTTMVGGPAQAIADVANSAEADLIVVGTRGHSAMAGIFLGGVTQRLLHIAHRPVLAVPPPARTPV